MPTAVRKMNIFYFSIYMLEEKEKQKQEVSAFANDANKYIDWLIFFLSLKPVNGQRFDRLSCQMNSRNAP